MNETDDRRALLIRLEQIKYVLEEVDRGASFLEDRDFGWSIDAERRAGIDHVRTAFDCEPALSALLPQLGSLLRDRGRVIGLEAIPHDEVKAAIRRIKRAIRTKD